MNPNSIATIVDGIIARESTEYTDNPKDKGGPTKFGITLATLSAWRKTKVTADDVKNLDIGEAKAIYEAVFIRQPGFYLINDDGLATLLIDWAVMSGPADAITALQEVLNAHGALLKADGILGGKTASAANAFTGGQRALRNDVVDAKILFHIDDVVKRPNQIGFLRGWVNRALAFRVN